MRERGYRQFRPGAVWRTLEETPRFLCVLGNVAIDERMLLAELDLESGKVWLEKATGRVYKQGRQVATAECVNEGSEEELRHDEGHQLGGRGGRL